MQVARIQPYLAIPRVGFRLVPAVTPLNNGPGAPGAADPLRLKHRVALIIVSTILMALVLFWYLTGLRNSAVLMSLREPLRSFSRTVLRAVEHQIKSCWRNATASIRNDGIGSYLRSPVVLSTWISGRKTLPTVSISAGGLPANIDR